MDTLKFAKGWLISILEENRNNHEAQYEKAFAGYRSECIRVLEENLDAFKQGKRTRLVWSERPPENHTEDYDRVLSMLHNCVDGEVELDQQQFTCYVQDDWGWKEVWTSSNSKYLG